MMGQLSHTLCSGKLLESLEMFFPCSPCMLQRTVRHAPGDGINTGRRPQAGRPLDWKTAPWPSETARHWRAQRGGSGLEPGRES